MRKAIGVKNYLPGPAVGTVGNILGTRFGFGISVLGLIVLGIALHNHANKNKQYGF